MKSKINQKIMIFPSKSCRMILKRSQSMQLVSSPCPESLSIIRVLYLTENARKPLKFIEISLWGSFWALLEPKTNLSRSLEGVMRQVAALESWKKICRIDLHCFWSSPSTPEGARAKVFFFSYICQSTLGIKVPPSEMACHCHNNSSHCVPY